MWIHETYQQTIQGEGYWCGTPCDFIRLSGCPVQCSFCDTGYGDLHLDIPRHQQSIEYLVNQLKSRHVVITGGEPFLHKDLPDLVSAIADTGRQVAIETSGACWQPVERTWITLSPKEHINPQYPVVDIFWEIANEIKIVIANGSECEYYSSKINDSNVPIYLQPEWYDRDRTIPLTLELLKKHPYRLSLQIHKYLGVY